MTKKLLIVEEALKDLKAHWFEYIRTVSQAASKSGWQVEVACNRDAEPEIIRTFTCYPVFKHARYLMQARDKSKGERYYGFLLHSFRCLRVLWPFFKKHAYSTVFVPTVLVHHLLAWYIIMRLHPNKPAHLTLFFVTPPGEWDQKGQTTRFPASTIVLKTLLKLYRELVGAGKVTLALETREAKKQFEAISGIPFTLMPHPVPFADTGITSQVSSSSNGIAYKNHPAIISFGCFGFARYEKGSDLLKAAIEKTVQMNHHVDVHFTIQWTDPFMMPDGSVCGPGSVLENHSQITIINKPLVSIEYEALLTQTDCMILPYRNSSYHARVSRIAIEAVCNSIPVIYTKGGWLEENVENFGAGIGITDESVDELVQAILTLYADYPKYAALAKGRAYKARSYYAPHHFLKKLFHVEPIQKVRVDKTGILK